jgi:hypothetical protein
MTEQDQFGFRNYNLPKGIERHQTATPQGNYTDPKRLEQELSAVFENDWVMVGRVGMIPDSGDYFTAHVGTKPVIVMRQSDGSISAMGNFACTAMPACWKGRGIPKGSSAPTTIGLIRWTAR